MHVPLEPRTAGSLNPTLPYGLQSGPRAATAGPLLFLSMAEAPKQSRRANTKCFARLNQHIGSHSSRGTGFSRKRGLSLCPCAIGICLVAFSICGSIELVEPEARAHPL